MPYLYNNIIVSRCFDDYAPDKSGESDVSELLQRTLDDMAAGGGGTLLLSEGRYRLDLPIKIPTLTFLAGEGSDATILLCRHGRGNQDAEAQLSLSACSGVMRIALVYDAQSYASPIPYSPCIRQAGVDSVTLEDVAIIGAWRGVQCGPDGNELHYLKNVLIAPLDVGFYMDMTTDIGRMEGLTIDPSSAARYLPESSAVMLISYAAAHAVGIYMARSDWEYGHNIKISGCKTGMIITAVSDSGPNTQLSELFISECSFGIRFVNVNPYGVALTNSVISNSVVKGIAAIVCEKSFETVVQLCSVTLSGLFDYLIIKHGHGELTLYDCKFEQENDRYNERNSMIELTDGGLNVLNCELSPRRRKLIIYGESARASFIGCKNSDGFNVTYRDGATSENLYISCEYHSLPVPPEKSYIPYPYSLYPEFERLYNIDEYGAKGDGVTDCTSAVQTALDEAERNGGGTVFVPAGRYLCEGVLRVGENTELRGIAETPCHTMGGGSVLMTTHGRDDENGEPFITLAEKAGLRGLLIFYPAQNAATPVKYPWTVQNAGRFCRVVNTVIVNPWRGVNFGVYPSEGHYISYLAGAPIRCGALMSANDGGGWVENVQFNPHYWFRTSLPNAPRESDWHDFWHNQIKYLDALVLGRNKAEHMLNTFVFAANHGLLFVERDGGVTSGIVTGHGTDGGENGLCIRALGDVDFINTELVTIESPNRRIYLLAEKASTGNARFFNTLMWGAPHNAIVLRGANVAFICGNYQSQGECANIVEGGKSVFAACWFYKRGDNFDLRGGETTLIANRTWDGDVR